VVLVLVCGILGFHATRQMVQAILVKEAVPLRQDFRILPREIGRWKSVGEDEKLTDAVVESLGTDRYLSRSYAIDGDLSNGRLGLHVAYYTGMVDAVPHIPEVCFVGGGLVKSPGFSALMIPLDRSGWWTDDSPPPLRYLNTVSNGNGNDPSNPVDSYIPFKMSRTISGEFVRLPVFPDDNLTMNIRQYWQEMNPDHKFAAGYFFVANGGATPFSEKVRLMAFRLTDTHAYYCKVQLTYSHPERAVSSEELAEVGGEFLTDMLPEIMRCLPDWYEVLQGNWPEDDG